MGYENDIATGVAEMLAAEGVAEWAPTGVYASTGSTPVIFIGCLPDVERPSLSISTYVVEPAMDPNDSILGLQVRARALGQDPRTTNDLDDAVFVALGKRYQRLGEYPITKVRLASSASTGQDGSGRWVRSANYYITGPR